MQRWTLTELAAGAVFTTDDLAWPYSDDEESNDVVYCELALWNSTTLVDRNGYWLSRSTPTILAPDLTQLSLIRQSLLTSLDITAVAYHQSAPNGFSLASFSFENESELVVSATLCNPNSSSTGRGRSGVALFVQVNLAQEIMARDDGTPKDDGITEDTEDTRVLPTLWDDNCVTLPPGRCVTLTARTAARRIIMSQERRLTLQVSGWNVGKSSVDVEVVPV